MTSAPRVDLFTHIHKALRHGLFSVTGQVGATDWTDRASSQAAVAAWQELDGLLRSHAMHEDTYIFALLETKQPGATADLDNDHHVIEQEQRDTAEAITQAARSGDPADGLDAYRLLTRFCAHYLERLLQEELDVMPRLWTTCTDEELGACRQAFLATVPVDESALTRRWLLAAVDPTTLGALMPKTAPQMASA